jgi:hypothetical protein
MNEKNKQNIGFDLELRNFLDRISSLEISLPLVLSTLLLSIRQSEEKHNKFLKENLKKTNDKEGKEVFYIDELEKLFKLENLRKNVKNSRTAYEIICNNFLVSLVSQFDAFMGSLIKTVFYTRPELLNSSEKQLTFLQLSIFTELSEIKEYIIEKEVETVLRNSRPEQIKWLSNKCSVELNKELKIWPQFVELTERRNLFVHCDGKITSQYIQICKTYNYEFKEHPIIGKKININKEYFKNSYRCLYEFATKLVHVVWRKLIPEDSEKVERNLNDNAYDLILQKEYDLAIEILIFATETIKHHTNEKIKLYMLINKAQAYKWKGNKVKCEEILNSVDWNAKCEILKLANYTLKDDFENAIKLMEKIGSISEDIDKTGYKEWPLFTNLRKEQKFIDTYEKIFNEKYEIIGEKEL